MSKGFDRLYTAIRLAEVYSVATKHYLTNDVMLSLKVTLLSYTAIHRLEANSVGTIKTRLTRSDPLNLQVSLGYKPGPEGMPLC